MENERAYIVRRKMTSVDSDGSHDLARSHVQLFHYQHIDEAVFHLYAADINLYDRTTAKKNGLPEFAYSTSVLDAETGRLLLSLGYRQVKSTGKNKADIIKAVSSLELQPATGLISNNLKARFKLEAPDSASSPHKACSCTAPR